MPSPITDAQFAQVETMQSNIALVMMTVMDAAMEGMAQSMGQALGGVMDGVGEALGNALGAEPGERLDAQRRTPDERDPAAHAEPARDDRPLSERVPKPMPPGAPEAAARAGWLARVRKVRAQMQGQDQREQKARFRAVMTDEDAQRVLSLPAKHIPTRPSPAKPMTDEQIVDLIEAGPQEDPGMQAMMAEFMAIGQELQQRAGMSGE